MPPSSGNHRISGRTPGTQTSLGHQPPRKPEEREREREKLAERRTGRKASGERLPRARARRAWQGSASLMWARLGALSPCCARKLRRIPASDSGRQPPISLLPDGGAAAPAADEFLRERVADWIGLDWTGGGRMDSPGGEREGGIFRTRDAMGGAFDLYQHMENWVAVLLRETISFFDILRVRRSERRAFLY